MRLIDADAFRREIDNHWPFTKEEQSKHGIADIAKGTLLYVLNCMPTIKPERAKGKWEITDAYPHNVYCSECHKRFAQTHWAVWEDGSLPRDFCPNCGADMRKDGD